MLKKIKWTKKKIRIYLGMMMMYSFLSLVFFINFFLKVAVSLKDPVTIFLAAFVVWYMWMPTLMLIGLTYVLLVYVYKYDEETIKFKRKKDKHE